MWFLKLLILLLITQNALGYKILGVFHFPSRSHHILGSTLLKELADRGHEVTMISPYPLEVPHPNYNDIELTGVRDLAEEPQIRNLFMGVNLVSELSGILSICQYVSKVNEFALNHHAVKSLISSKQKFDVVIQLYFANDAHFGLAHYFGAYSVALCPIGSAEVVHVLTKNPSPISYIPNIILAYPAKMNFWQRVANALLNMFFNTLLFISDSQQNLLITKYLPESPTVQELRNNISLVLMNSHFAVEGPRPYSPNMIQVGGLHVKPPKDLTNDLKYYMDSADDGVILFSLGSNIRSSELPNKTIQTILNIFATLPQKILWKFETKTGAFSIPPNVMIWKWLPQSDILAHPNLKVFVTHGGILSATEAVYHGIPIVAIPIFGDQLSNVNDAVDKGYAVKVDIHDLTFEKLSCAINEVLTNTSYRSNVQNLSRIFKDQPTGALDTAVYWIEYVVKHKGAHHLKSPAVQMEWYQLYSIDVFVFLISILICLLLGVFYILRKILFRLVRTSCTNRIKVKRK